jgi:phosphatidylserine/phosphatidylglycerophosphate/cardiolipin synthase-like enzyme
MENAINRGVVIRFIVRADEKNPPGQLKWLREHNEAKHLEQLKWLGEHKIKVDQVERLHAKIYLNERTVLISSMNITDASTTNSREFAMIVRSDDDVMKFRDYVAQLTGRVNVSQHIPAASRAGFCIRDGNAIIFNTSRPLCDKCYPNWAKFENKNYVEKYCHSCGKRSETTYARPLCLECYKKLD